MVEQSMFFALGFLVAGFIAVLLTPAFNRRAGRLANRRMRALFPVSLEEVAAERDHLRAEFAVTTRAMERKQARTLDEKAAALGDAGRQLSNANTLKHERDESREELKALQEAHAGLETSFGSAREKLAATMQERDAAQTALTQISADKNDLTRNQTAAATRIDSQRVAIAELEERIDALTTNGAQQKIRADQLSEALLVEKNAVRTLQETLAGHRANAARLTDRMAAMEASRDEAQGAVRVSEKLEAELRSLRDRLSQAQAESEALRHKLAAHPAATGRQAAGAAAAGDVAAAGALRDEIANFQAALAALPRTASDAPGAGDDVLRQRITDIAGAIMARPEPAASPASSPAPSPDRRNGRSGRGAPSSRKTAP